MHKAFIYIDSTDESGQATVAAGVTEVIAAYGVRVLVRATDEELAALEAAGLRVELADEMDSLPFPGASTQTDVPTALKSGIEAEGQSKAKSKTKAKTKTKPAKKKSTKTSATAFSELSEDPVHWLVQFVGPPLSEWVDGVRATGAEIVGPIPPNIILVRMTTAQADAVRALDRVQWVGPYQASFKVHPDIPAPSSPPDTGASSKKALRSVVARAAETPAPPERTSVTVVLFDASALASVVAEIEALDGVVQQADMDTIIADVPPSAIPDIAALSVVARISPYEPPTLAMQMARRITMVQTAFDTHGLDGEGEIVCIADTGLDMGVISPALHSDFSRLGVAGQVRVIRGYAPEQVNPGLAAVLQRGGLWDDRDGHGTHVAGITLGNGSAAGGDRPNAGVAFKAQLVMQAVRDNGNAAAVPPILPALGGVPPNLNRLFETVYITDGARVHNNSWGGSTPFSRYSDSAYQIDEFVWRNPDMVIVFATANLGTDGPRVVPPPAVVPPLVPPVDLMPGAPDGVVDFASLSHQSTNRNGISVGGTENTRTGIWGGNPDLTWGLGGLSWPRPGFDNFQTPPQDTDPVANNAEHLMAFSSRGPTLSSTGAAVVQRIKPDVVAPGSSILSCRSRAPGASATSGWGNSPHPAYIYEGGTSMAAPHVAGMCALIRQYLRKVHHLSDPNNPVTRRRRPSAALIKALLVHGARKVIGLNAADAGTVPGNHQGWGRVDLRRSLFSLLKSSLATQDNTWLPRRTIFIDDPNITVNSVALAPNRTHSVRVTVADVTVPLRATLVWTDHPGPIVHTGAVINVLQLQITRVSDGTITTFALPAAIAPPGLAPLSNNVQQIDITAPAVGDYLVQVNANNIASVAVAGIEQDFALVISGAISHSDHRVPGTMAALPDLAFVDAAPDNSGRELHDGLAPAPELPRGNLGSPDIWVNRAQDPDPAHGLNHLEVGPTDIVYVYVRVRNLGFAPANGAQINLYWADPRTPMAYPADWKPDGLKVNGVTGNQLTADVPARAKVGGAWRDGEVTVGPFEWTMPRGFERVALFVRAVHPDDPIVNEGDVRWDNNVARRNFSIQDNTTQVQGEPSCFDKFIFWIISGFSSRRDIELRVALAYQDIRDGQVKPLPAGVEVEIYDYDPVSGDDKLAQGRTLVSGDATGQPTSVLHLTFSNYESGEGSPDIYLKVLKPTGPDFAEFVDNSFFAAGATSWVSKNQATATGGFFAEDFDGNKIGIPDAVTLTLRPVGIQVRAAFEYFSTTGDQFHKLPQGIEVKIKDSKASAPQPLLARATVDANGEIVALLPRSGDYRPSIYFEIEKNVTNEARFAGVDYFQNQSLWDSRTHQGEIIAADNTISTISGHFENWQPDSLVAINQRLRFHLEGPGILMHLRFQYYDHEAPGGYVDLPPGTEVEAWEDDLAAVSSLEVRTVGANGRVDFLLPKRGRNQLNLFARVVMRRRLTTSDVIIIPTVDVLKAGNIVHWDTKGHSATDGTAGAFNAVVDHVGTAAAPLVFQIGVAADTGRAADNTDELTAPFILKVIGQVHDWLRARWGNDWRGISNLHVNLLNGLPAEGSRFTDNETIHLNVAHIIGPLLDHRNREIIAHHYGHLVLEWFFISPLRTLPTVANHHTFDRRVEQPNQQRRVLAEGWAEYVNTAHRPTPLRPDGSGGQTGWRGLDSNGANSSGEIVPVAVANALWRLDRDVVGQGNGDNIRNAVNQHRFQALIANPIKALPVDEAQQAALHLYRLIQRANLAPADLIPPHGIEHIRQEVRRVFEANGLVFTRGTFTAAAVRVTAENLAALPVVPELYRFQVGPADRARLNVAEMGRITAYRIQAALVVPPSNFVDLEPVVLVTHANQRETIDVSLTAARQSGVLASPGAYDFRVVARDEFGAWDTFADDFTGNTPGATGVTNNDTWRRARLSSIQAGPAGGVP